MVERFELGKTYQLKSHIESNDYRYSYVKWGEDFSKCRAFTVVKVNTRPDSEGDQHIDIDGVDIHYFKPSQYNEAPVAHYAGIPIYRTDLTAEVFPMNIETIKAKNITEARKQVETEKSNAEIEFAKRVLKTAIDEKDRLDAQIGELEKKREEQQKIIDKFGK